MSGTRVIGKNFETTDGGLHLSNRLVKTEKTALVFATGELIKSFTVRVAATLEMIAFEMPAFAGADPTGTVSIENSDGVEIYSKGDMVENETHVRLVDIPLVGENTIKVTLSTDPLSDGTCYVTLYFEG